MPSSSDGAILSICPPWGSETRHKNRPNLQDWTSLVYTPAASAWAGTVPATRSFCSRSRVTRMLPKRWATAAPQVTARRQVHRLPGQDCVQGKPDQMWQAGEGVSKGPGQGFVAAPPADGSGDFRQQQRRYDDGHTQLLKPRQELMTLLVAGLVGIKSVERRWHLQHRCRPPSPPSDAFPKAARRWSRENASPGQFPHPGVPAPPRQFLPVPAGENWPRMQVPPMAPTSPQDAPGG
jgi:hypothetical protein